MMNPFWKDVLNYVVAGWVLCAPLYLIFRVVYRLRWEEKDTDLKDLLVFGIQSVVWPVVLFIIGAVKTFEWWDNGGDRKVVFRSRKKAAKDMLRKMAGDKPAVDHAYMTATQVVQQQAQAAAQWNQMRQLVDRWQQSHPDFSKYEDDMKEFLLRHPELNNCVGPTSTIALDEAYHYAKLKQGKLGKLSNDDLKALFEDPKDMLDKQIKKAMQDIMSAGPKVKEEDDL